MAFVGKPSPRWAVWKEMAKNSLSKITAFALWNRKILENISQEVLTHASLVVIRSHVTTEASVSPYILELIYIYAFSFVFEILTYYMLDTFVQRIQLYSWLELIQCPICRVLFPNLTKKLRNFFLGLKYIVTYAHTHQENMLLRKMHLLLTCNNRQNTLSNKIGGINQINSIT